MTAPAAGYKIAFEGPWIKAERAVVMDAIKLIAGPLAVCLGIEDLAQAWNTVFPIQVVFRAVSKIEGGFDGFASGRLVRLVRGLVSLPLVIHELMHVLQFQFVNRFGYSKSPVHSLMRGGVIDENGEFVTGWRDGAYRRNNGRLAPENGYVSDLVERGYQMHPAWQRGGKEAKEDAADILLNYFRDTFVDNPAGRALEAFAESQAGQWKVAR